MRNVFGLAAVLAAAALIVGCIESKQDYSLNPDGSGKVVFEMKIMDMSNMMQAGDPNQAPPDPMIAAKQQAKRILDESQGVDVWSDVEVGRTDDGRIRFKGTAYFKDLGKLKFQQADLSGMAFKKDPKGGMILEIEDKDDAKPDAKDAPKPPALTPEEITTRMQAQRAQFQQAKAMMGVFLAQMKIEIAFRLPGTVAECSNFKKQPDGALTLAFDGPKMLQAIDQCMADDNYVKEIVMKGEGGDAGPKMNDAMCEKLFGTKGPVRARITGDLKPVFAYDAETGAAKAKFPEMIKALGLDKVPAPAPMMGGMPPAMDGPPGAPPSDAPKAPAKKKAAKKAAEAK